MITVSAVISRPLSVFALNGRAEKSTSVTKPLRMSAPNFRACVRISSMSCGPVMPFGCPGKFSTSVVIVSCPPGCIPSMTRGEMLARDV